MELRQLRYFLAVAEEGHFTRAASRLYVSQPNLSQQIRQLEDELGATLIDRSGRQARLTAAGEVLARHARRVLSELDDARLAIDELAGLRRGALALGAVQTVNGYLLPEAVAAFTARYPGISLRVEERSAGEIECGVADGALQLGIGFAPAGSPDVEAEHLYHEELALIVPAGHPWSGREYLAVGELDEAPMVLLGPDFCTRRLWEESARGAGIRPRVSLEMNTISGILAAVRQTASVTALPPQTLAAKGADGLVAVPLRDPTPRRAVGLLYRRGGYRCAASQAFSALLRGVLDRNGWAAAG
ncbi:MAG TPA: transcriptional regulator CynR [Herpetosiphonaceae bacterium]|nr:transcriptional regulator CynR [Herpetosiphonaceae bacterium]